MDTSTLLALAEKLEQLIRNPHELAQELSTNDWAVEILQEGLDLYVAMLRTAIPASHEVN
jgi:hypothetical protein